MTTYNKAIRDKIPEIIEKSGNFCNFKELSDEDFLIEIEKKLSEEVNEYMESKNPEELSDILEVIFKISEIKGISKEDLENIRIKKVSERGGFDRNLFLIETKGYSMG